MSSEPLHHLTAHSSWRFSERGGGGGGRLISREKTAPLTTLRADVIFRVKQTMPSRKRVQETRVRRSQADDGGRRAHWQVLTALPLCDTVLNRKSGHRSQLCARTSSVTEVEGWTDPGAPGVLVTRKAAPGSESLKRKGGLPARRKWRSASRRRRRTTRKSRSPRSTGKKKNTGTWKSQPTFPVRQISRVGLHTCATTSKGVMFHELAAVFTTEGGSPQTTNLCRNCCNKRLLERKKAMGTGSQ